MAAVFKLKEQIRKGNSPNFAYKPFTENRERQHIRQEVAKKREEQLSKPIVPVEEEAFTKDRRNVDEDDGPVAWDPPSIMDHLDDRATTVDVAKVIKSIKDSDIVWDHGATEKGRESDTNLFRWLQAYSAHECIRKRSMDDLVFEDGGSMDASQPPNKRRRR